MRRLWRNGPALMLGASASFALMALFVKRVSHEIPEGEVVAARSIVVLVMALSLAVATGAVRSWRDLKGGNRGMLVVRGFFGAASMFTYFFAIHHLKLGDAVLLTYMSPLLVSLMAPLVLRERVPRILWVALAIGFAGVWVVAAGQPQKGATEISGVVAGVVSAFTAAAAYISVRRLAATDSPMTIVVWFAALGLLSGMATFPFAFVTPSAPLLLDLLLVGIFAAFAQILMTQSYAVSEAARVSVYGYATPVLSYALGMLKLGESPGVHGAAGAALVLIAGVVASERVRRRVAGGVSAPAASGSTPPGP
ncbi:MAG TPA: DMT family transporter [bacterium]|nr:DMT family transporter [bacterium]